MTDKDIIIDHYRKRFLEMEQLNSNLKAENDLLNEKLHQADIDYYKMKAELETKNEVLRKAIEEAIKQLHEAAINNGFPTDVIIASNTLKKALAEVG